MHGKRSSLVVCLDDLPPGVSCKDLKRLVQDAVDSTRRQPTASPLDTAASPGTHSGIDLDAAPNEHGVLAFRPGGSHANTCFSSLPVWAGSHPTTARPADRRYAGHQHRREFQCESPGDQATLRLRSNVQDCVILRITDKSSGATRYQGMVAVAPASCALAAVAVLNRFRWRGVPLQARYLRQLSPNLGQSDSDAEPDQPAPISLELVSRTPAPAKTVASHASQVALGGKKPAFAH